MLTLVALCRSVAAVPPSARAFAAGIPAVEPYHPPSDPGDWPLALQPRQPSHSPPNLGQQQSSPPRHRQQQSSPPRQRQQLQDRPQSRVPAPAARNGSRNGVRPPPPPGKAQFKAAQVAAAAAAAAQQSRGSPIKATFRMVVGADAMGGEGVQDGFAAELAEFLGVPTGRVKVVEVRPILPSASTRNLLGFCLRQKLHKISGAAPLTCCRPTAGDKSTRWPQLGRP